MLFRLIMEAEMKYTLTCEIRETMCKFVLQCLIEIKVLLNLKIARLQFPYRQLKNAFLFTCLGRFSKSFWQSKLNRWFLSRIGLDTYCHRENEPLEMESHVNNSNNNKKTIQYRTTQHRNDNLAYVWISQTWVACRDTRILSITEISTTKKT